jgi:anti-sigma B factor antagonist
MEGIQVSVEKVGSQGDVSVIRVGGYIDTTTSAELERALDSLLKTGVVHIVIDLGNVDYISSAGWGIFISEIKGIRERGGDLKLARMIPDVYEVFELLEFHFILKAYDSIEEAIKDFDLGGREIDLTTDAKFRDGMQVVETGDALLKKAGDEGLASADVEDKVRRIVKDHPTLSAAQISKELNSEKYGFVRLGTLGVWRMLRKLNLGSKRQREGLSRAEDSAE